MKYLSLGLLVVVLLFLGVQVVVRNHLDHAAGPVRHELLVQEQQAVFSPAHDNINILIINLKNPGFANKDKYQLNLSSGDDVLFAQEFSGFNVGDPSDLRFQFPPLIGVANKQITLSVKPVAESAGVQLQIGLDANGQVARQVFYRETNIEASFSAFLAKVTQDKVFLLQWVGLITLLVIAYEKTRTT